MKLPTYVLTLPEDEVRYSALAHQLEEFDFLDVIPVDGIRGGLLSDVAVRALTRNEWAVNHKGTLGCFLTHTRAWQLIASRREPVSLVLENDAVIEEADVLRHIEIPEGMDIAFCNDRTAYPGPNGFRSVEPIPKFAEDRKSSIGGYAYLLTPHGAEKLLSFVERDSFFSHVDLRMIAYSLPRGWVSYGGRQSDNIAALRNTYPDAHKLNAFSFFPPVASHKIVISRRQAEDDANATKMPA